MLDIYALITEQTCGEACWHAREDVCRCSCGGKNHGCLRNASGDKPTRTRKLAGIMYELAGVGTRKELAAPASAINKAAGYKSIDKPFQATTFRNGGEVKVWMQYKYTWSSTDEGAPARLVYPTQDQISRWPELSAYRELSRYEQSEVIMLWRRLVPPTPPTQPIVDEQGNTMQPEPEPLPAPSYPMIEGPGAPQYTFSPPPDAQLSLL